MSRKIHAREQLSLLDWNPPEAVMAFDPFLLRANSWSGRFSRAISISLDSCGQTRQEVADAMSSHMGKAMSLNVLNAYASTARDSHEISVSRFDALLSATRDRRLLEFFAEGFGWSVIDRRYLPAIELAALSEHKREVARREREIRATAGRGGRW